MAINKNDLFQRVCVGAIYIVLVGLCTLLSWWTTLLMVVITAAICCNEFLVMAQNAGHRPYVKGGTVIAAAIPLAMALNSEGTHIVALGLAAAFIGGVVCMMRFVCRDEDQVEDVALTVFGYLYVGLTLASFLMLRNHWPDLEGGLLCLFILFSVWANDGFAYLGGSAFGRHKFAPKISPKKTWEGVICGIVGGMIFWLLIPLLCPNCGFGYVWAALSGLMCGICGIMGDLAESHIKRSFNTKDSGNLMPGHGGLLDRSDSLLFVSVIAYFMIVIAPLGLSYVGVIV